MIECIAKIESYLNIFVIMAWEHLPSQPDMSKKDAITGVEQETTSNLTQFRNWVTGWLSHASAMTSIFILTTFNANAQLPKSNDVAKNTPKKVKLYEPKTVKKDTIGTIVKTWEKQPGDSIKNKTEYDAEYAKALKLREKAKKENTEAKEHFAELTEQRNMLMGCIIFLERIQKQNGIVTEADVKLAKWALEDISEIKRLPELKGLVASAKRIYVYLAEQPPQTLYTKN